MTTAEVVINHPHQGTHHEISRQLGTVGLMGEILRKTKEKGHNLYQEKMLKQHATPLFEWDGLASHVVDSHKIGKNDIDLLARIPSDNYTEPARAFATIIAHLLSDNSLTSNHKGERRAGKLLSDLLEVLPQDIAAKMIVGAVDQNVVSAIKQNYPDINLLRYVIEGLACMPDDLRISMFKKIKEITSNKYGAKQDILKLRNQFVINWSNTNQREYSGMHYVALNFGEKEGMKITDRFRDVSYLNSLSEAAGLKDANDDKSPQ